MTPPIKSLNTRVRALEDELRQVKERARQPGSSGGTTAGDSRHDSSHTQNAAQRCRPASDAEGNCAPELTVQPDSRNCARACESHTCRTHVNDGISGTTQQGIALTDADSDRPSGTGQTCKPAASKHRVVSHAPGIPGFPGGEGRMMQISWREITSAITRRDADVASDSNHVHSHLSATAVKEIQETQSDKFSGRIVQSTGHLSPEPQWSQPERTAMTQRLTDLCRNYDAAALVWYQPLHQGMLVTTGAGHDATLMVGSRPVLPQRAGRKQTQMGRALHPFAVGEVVRAQTMKQLGQEDCASGTGASSVPEVNQRLGVIDFAGEKIISGQGMPLHVVSSDVQSETTVNPLQQGHSDARVVAEHGLMTLLTFAVTSVVWAPPVV